MRGIVFGLIFTNLAYLAWNVFVPAAAERRAPVPFLDTGSGVLLISEVSEEQLQRVPAQQVASVQLPEEEGTLPAEEQARYCAEIGPFRNEEDARNFTSTHGERMSLTVDMRQVPASPDYRVFLPPFASRELASSTLETLRAVFANNNLAIDTYLVPRGDLENSIALGLFSEQSNALNVQRQMQSLGYQVVVREEEKTVTQAWVLAADVESALDFQQQWAQMRLSRSYIEAGEKLCETIAHTPQFP